MFEKLTDCWFHLIRPFIEIMPFMNHSLQKILKSYVNRCHITQGLTNLRVPFLFQGRGAVSEIKIEKARTYFAV